MDDKNYISGIYNYCDRWCEKCPLTANCLLFTNESKIITHQILNDGDISGIKDILMDDIPDEEFEAFEMDEEEEENIFEQQENLTDCSEEEVPEIYLEKLADEFFDKAHSLIKIINDELNLFPPEIEKLSDPEFNRLYTNFEILNWYHSFIGPKIRRAALGKHDLQNEEDEEINEFTLYDINGSAKIASIAISRLTDSLNYMYKVLNDHRQEISALLIIAGQMQNEIEIEFPGYKEFVRPGFDE